MKYYFCVFLCFKLTMVNSQQHLFKNLENNIKSYYLKADSRSKEINDIIKNHNKDLKIINQVSNKEYLKNKSDSSLVVTYLRLLNNNGSWSDINYKDDKRSGWSPKQHVDRILALTMIYCNPKSENYQNPEIKIAIHKSMDFWFKAKLVCSNWWYNEIGIPKILGLAFIFLKHELSPDEMREAIIVLNKSSFRQTGQNKVWQAGNILFKAILLEDEKLAKRARDTIFSELRITSKEGVQTDFSFHQHGPQQQFGNYGLSFVTSISFWARILSGTSLKLEKDNIFIMRNFILEGLGWVSWKGAFDVNSLGRQFFKDIQTSKSLELAYAAIDMIYVDKNFRNIYKSLIINNYSPLHISHFSGTKHFWRSDMTVHHTSKWFSSVKLSSNRIKATEALNGENLKGYYLGGGTTFIYVDGTEYDNIYPVWDWKKLPGVTNFQKLGPLPILTIDGYRNKGDFSGGITNGKNGITAFKLNRDSLKANKAWFYLNNKIICLGSDITTNLPDAVSTTINQTFTKGDIQIFDNQIKTMSKGELTSSTLNWIYHNKVGYYPILSSKYKIINQSQSGSWRDIALIYEKENNIKKDIFTIEIEHGKQVKDAKYAYVILPGISISEMLNYTPDFEVLSNTKEAQVIINKNNTLCMVVAYQPIEIKIVGLNKINFKQAGLYMLEKKGNNWILNMVDPTQKLDVFNFTIENEIFSVNMPKGLNAGKTTSFNIKSTLLEK